MFSWVDLQISLGSRVMPTWSAIAAFSEECIEKLIHGVLLLYLVVSSATRTLAARVAKLRLHVAASCSSQ